MGTGKGIQTIENRILLVRGMRVMIDADLAELYGVTTKRLNEQVKRNRNRFPSDFMFKMTQNEKNEVVAICDHLEKLKFSKTLPLAFTEHGAIMAANVLNSDKAVEMSVFVVRAFVKLREASHEHREISRKLAELERRVGKHDEAIGAIIKAIRDLMGSREKGKPGKIGFGRE